MQTKQELMRQYFDAVERQRIKHFDRGAAFRVKVGGRIVELWFPNETMRDQAMYSLKGFVTQDSGAADARFYYWYDTYENYIPQGKNAQFSPVPPKFREHLICFDPERRNFYQIAERIETKDMAVCGRTLVQLFSRWASACELIMVHAAAVGVNGKGVLVVGRSGSGKTTFSLSCLVAGMDFVSDDCTLLSTSGELRAMPLYSSVAVTPEICTALPQLEGICDAPFLINFKQKRQFDMPRERIADSLDIKAIVMPIIAGEEEPSIQKAGSGSPMVHLLHSTAVQTWRERDTELIRQMAQRLSGLPVYEMRMSPQLSKNPALLREFIKENL